MPNNLNNRLAKLEASLAAMHQQHTQQSDRKLMDALRAKYEAMPDEEVLALYNGMLNEPITDPKLAAELAALETMDCQQLITNYMQNL